MNVGFDDGAIGAQFLALGHSMVSRQLDDPIMDAMQGRGLNQHFAVALRAMVRDGVVINSAEPPPLGIPDNFGICRLITPAHQATHHAETQGRLGGCGRASIPRCFWSGTDQGVGHLQHKFGIIE